MRTELLLPSKELTHARPQQEAAPPNADQEGRCSRWRDHIARGERELPIKGSPFQILSPLGFATAVPVV